MRRLVIKIFVFCWVLATPFFVFDVSTALADTFGQNQSFFIETKYDAFSRPSVTATLRIISDRAYGYIEDDYWNSINQTARDQLINQINILLDEFDDRIYPIETQFFGSEPNPGIDGDPKITILFSPLIENAGGYFSNSNIYPRRDDNNTSNQREMIYINVHSLSDQRKIKIFLGHEFQHLIAVNQKEKLYQVSDDVWINELRSEYAPTLLGYDSPFENSNLQRRLQSFLANPADSLTEWKNLAADYGQVALFGEYLTEHWPAKILGDSLKSGAISIPSINQALAQNNSSDTFFDLFRYWLIANIINDRAENLKFGYTREGLKNFKVNPSKTVINLLDSNSSIINDNLKDWQPRWYEISQFAAGENGFLKISFSSSSLTSFRISYLIVKSTGQKISGIFTPTIQNKELFIDGIGRDTSKVIIMPIKIDKLSGFESEEIAVDLSTSLVRVKEGPTSVPLPTSEPTPTLLVMPVPSRVAPQIFNLKEGDFIRAEGDNDIYIINDFGYKRLVLSPKICLQYGHLGRRGCFGAVKIVTPSVRDTFKTSWLFTNGETRDGKVYHLKTTGEDSATLNHLNISGQDFLSQGGDFNSVFLINTREQNSYQLGQLLLSLPK